MFDVSAEVMPVLLVSLGWIPRIFLKELLELSSTTCVTPAFGVTIVVVFGVVGMALPAGGVVVLSGVGMVLPAFDVVFWPVGGVVETRMLMSSLS